MGSDLVAQAEVEAAVRGYLARVARRYAPLAIGLIVLMVVALTVPTVSLRGSSPQLGSPSQGQANSSLVTGAGPSGPQQLASPVPATAAGGSSVGSGGGALAFGSVPTVPPGITAPPPTGSPGATRGGVPCGPGVKQVPWTAYAPPCIPAYQGNNGGAIGQGVSATTITAVFRRTNSAEEKAAFAAVGNAAPSSDDAYLYDLRSYLDLFNRTFELYGRHVQVADYNGVGDNLQEDQGQDLQGAESDAATAQSTYHAFMDLSSSPTLASTQPYEEDLAAHNVIAIGAVGLPKRWFRRFAPYEYSIEPDGSGLVAAAVGAICERMNGLPAVYAGDPTFRAQPRKFGLITPDNPEYMELGDELQQGIRSTCGASIAKRASYSINVATEEQQSVSVIAQMSTNRISTVVCICDPVVEIFLSQNADSQNYFPEWNPTNWLDLQGRETAADQWAHAISVNWVIFPPRAQSEAYRVWKIARPNEEPHDKYYPEAYWTALYIMDVLQQAGPDLTPATFQRAAFSLPQSSVGMFGLWSGGAQAFSPAQDVVAQYWDANATSNLDNNKGAWVTCESGKWFSLTDPSSYGPAHTQLHCFGK